MQGNDVWKGKNDFSRTTLLIEEYFRCSMEEFRTSWSLQIRNITDSMGDLPVTENKAERSKQVDYRKGRRDFRDRHGNWILCEMECSLDCSRILA